MYSPYARTSGQHHGGPGIQRDGNDGQMNVEDSPNAGREIKLKKIIGESEKTIVSGGTSWLSQVESL